MRKLLIILAVLALVMPSCAKGKRTRQEVGVAFYNVENLFDTIPNNPKGLDEEYTPDGKRNWNSEKYCNKIQNLAFCISQMPTSNTPEGPAIIGIAEVENETVLQDLVADPQIKRWGLQYVHHDSPDARGIDVACIYNPKYFTVDNVTNHRLKDLDFATRDQMCVVGRLMGQKVGVIINHWPSRLGGQKESSPHREAAAALTKSIADSLWRVDSSLGIIIMGDLNDDPFNKSCALVLGAKRDRMEVSAHGFFNPWWDILDSGHGTLTYKGNWNLFDQIIISGNLLDGKGDRLRYNRAEIRDFAFLKDTGYGFEGNPLRTFGGSKYLNGYSDHFPTEIFLTIEIRQVE